MERTKLEKLRFKKWIGMKYTLKKNTAAEQAYIRDLERSGPLEKVERGCAHIVPFSKYPEPLKRFFARQRDMVHLRLSPNARQKLEQLSRATDIPVDQLALRWVQQGIAREAG